jgi:hypothetical protein
MRRAIRIGEVMCCSLASAGTATREPQKGQNDAPLFAIVLLTVLIEIANPT